MLGHAPPLTQQQLQRLRKHKYRSVGRSLIEPPFQRLWNWQVLYVPAYVHPNLLTLAGLMFVLSGLLTFIFYSPDMRQDIPSWCYFYNALCIFLYQSLDAVDGKHARNLNLCSPIGELWDHGFDAFTAGALAIEFCMVLKLGNNAALAFACVLTSLLSFFSSHWQAYCSGLIEFGLFDVTEVLTIVIIGNIVSGIFGQDLWLYQVTKLMKLNEFVIFILVIFSVQMFMVKFFSIIKNKGIGPQGTTVAETSIVTPIIPFIIMSLFYLSIFMKSRSKHEILAKFFAYHLIFTVALAKINIRLVVCQMTKSELHFIDSEFIVPTILFLNQYFGYLIPEHLYIIYIGLCLSALDFIIYMTRITFYIAKDLNIPVLTTNYVNENNKCD